MEKCNICVVILSSTCCVRRQQKTIRLSVVRHDSKTANYIVSATASFQLGQLLDNKIIHPVY